MKIHTEGFEPITLFISPFSSDLPGIEETLRDIIANDLKISGFFQVTKKSTVDIAKMDNNAFSQIELSCLLEGKIEIKGQIVQFIHELYQLPERHLISHKSWTSSISQIRDLAHAVSDEITYCLTGIAGVACTKIAFTRKRGNANEVMVMDFDGERYQAVTQGGDLNLMPSWAPDGKHLAFISYESGRPCLNIYSFDNGISKRMLNVQGLQSAPTWSPDGLKIVLSLSIDDNIDLYMMDVQTGTLKRLTNHPAIETSPAWSPDGEEIAFTSDRSGSPQVYLMEADGRRQMRLTYYGSYNDSPTWSPNGDVLVFVSREEKGFQVYTINVNGTDQRRITDGLASYENPSWSPDGLRLAFASNREKNWNIFICNSDGSGIRKLTPWNGCECPRWSPRLNLKQLF
ncbi:PD40 domain-containing protein [bacterium]|nr:PD40 domain-containing protein [bacterium]RQV96335.1 MAG: hypothetical protein EH221_05030 [bacterium]